MQISDTTGQERTGRLQTTNSERTARGVVVTCPRPGETDPRRHENVTRRAIAEKPAALKGYEYVGDHDAATDYAGKVYFVPAETLVGIDAARAMGVRSVRRTRTRSPIACPRARPEAGRGSRAQSASGEGCGQRARGAETRKRADELAPRRCRGSSDRTPSTVSRWRNVPGS